MVAATAAIPTAKIKARFTLTAPFHPVPASLLTALATGHDGPPARPNVDLVAKVPAHTRFVWCVAKLSREQPYLFRSSRRLEDFFESTQSTAIR